MNQDRIKKPALIKKMVDNLGFFAAIVDCSLRSGGSNELPMTEFIHLSREHLRHRPTDEQEWFSRKKLLRNGIFLRFDREAEVLHLNPFIIELVRFCDASRIQELSSQDFEEIRSSFESLLNQLEIILIDTNNVDYQDWQRAFYKRATDTAHRLQQNVAALESHANRITSEISQQSEGSSLYSIYDDVLHVYRRYLIPCQEFLMADKRLPNAKINFSNAINSILTKHEHAGLTAVTYSITSLYNELCSYSKTLSDIQSQMQRYLRLAERDKNEYAAIEYAYNMLAAEIEVSVNLGGKKNKYIRQDNSFFQQFTEFEGIKRSRNERCLGIGRDLAFNLSQFIEEQMGQAQLQQDKIPLPSVQQSAEDIAGQLAREKRDHIILKLINEMEWHRTESSLPRSLHEFLSVHSDINDYSLYDFLTGYGYCLSRFSQNIRPMYSNCRLEDDLYFIEINNTQLQTTELP